MHARVKSRVNSGTNTETQEEASIEQLKDSCTQTEDKSREQEKITFNEEV